MISGTEPLHHAITGVPHASASIITRPNGSAQSIGNSSAEAPRKNSFLRSPPTSPMNSTKDDSRSAGERSILKVSPILVVNLGCNLQGHSRLLAISMARSSRFSGEILPRNAKIIAGLLAERCADFAADHDRRSPASWPSAAGAAARPKSRRAALRRIPEKRLDIVQINLPVQGADVCARQAPDQRKVDVIAVKVDHIKPGQIAKDQFQHANVMGQRLPRVRITPSAVGQTGTRWPLVCESPLANRVTS